MAAGKEILTKIRSVQNTQKITKAMQMVSTSKMRKIRERIRLARPYAEKVRLVMNHLAQTNSGHGIKLLEPHREIRKAGFILIISDKGLCGGLNTNVLERSLAQVQEYQEKGIVVEVVCLGSRGLAVCQNIRLNIIASATNLGDTPKMETLLEPLTEIFQRYEKHRLDVIQLVYSGFINTMRQEPRMEVLLSVGQSVMDEVSTRNDYNWDCRYEPSPVAMLEYLVRRYLKSVVYQALGGNMVSEQTARMVAMKAAIDNAGSAIKELRLVYNKSRQATVTTELTEIVVGAATV